MKWIIPAAIGVMLWCELLKEAYLGSWLSKAMQYADVSDLISVIVIGVLLVLLFRKTTKFSQGGKHA